MAQSIDERIQHLRKQKELAELEEFNAKIQSRKATAKSNADMAVAAELSKKRREQRCRHFDENGIGVRTSTFGGQRMVHFIESGPNKGKNIILEKFVCSACGAERANPAVDRIDQMPPDLRPKSSHIGGVSTPESVGSLLS